MISPQTVRDGLVAVLTEIPDIGRVHTRRRIFRTEQDIRTHLYDVGLDAMRGWMIAPGESDPMQTERHPGFNAIGRKGGGQAFTWFRMQIDGYATVNDADGSEESFADLIWTVADTLNRYGVAPITGAFEQSEANVTRFGFAFLAGSHLLHHGRIAVAFKGKTI